MLHRLRAASFVEKRTAAANQLRAAFAEVGIIAPWRGSAAFQGALQFIQSKAESFARLPQALPLALCESAWQWQSCEAAVRRMDVEIAAGVKTSERAKRLTGLPTIGPVGASAIDASSSSISSLNLLKRTRLCGLGRVDPGARTAPARPSNAGPLHQEGRRARTPAPPAGAGRDARHPAWLRRGHRQEAPPRGR